MNKITVILTCFNRKYKTVNCVKKLVEGNINLDFKFIIVDDNSSDGTVEEIQKLGYNIVILNGDGSLYWNRGMYKGIKYILDNNIKSDFYLLVNDDVKFYEESIEKIIKQYINQVRENEAVIVGATCNSKGELTYGGIKYRNKNSIKYYTVYPSDKGNECDTMNANCVLIPQRILNDVGNLDYYYKHSLGDFDYGFKIIRSGYKIYSSFVYVGICERNSLLGTWCDKNLSIIERLRKKENVKGLPVKQWFYFLNKNFGVLKATLYTITSYIKLII